MSDNYQAVYDATLQAARRVFSGGDACDAVERATSNALGNVGQNITAAFDALTYELQRPSRTMRPKLIRERDKWWAFYGEESGTVVCGCGASPELACADFDVEWIKKLPSEGTQL